MFARLPPSGCPRGYRSEDVLEVAALRLSEREHVEADLLEFGVRQNVAAVENECGLLHRVSLLTETLRDSRGITILKLN